MGTLKKDFKYKLIKNFLTPEEIEIGKYYMLLKHKNNTDEFDFKQNNVGDSFFYRDSFAETIMMRKISLMEKESNLKLFPTYSFCRVYSFNADLKPHKDRPSCEVSVTVMFGSDGTPWPIFMNGQPIEMQPGDAVMYLGCELEHWRENFKGDWHAQAFLHYVDQNGPYADFKFDRQQITPEI